MEDKLTALKEKAFQELDEISALDALEKLRVDYLGRKGILTDLLKSVKERFDNEGIEIPFPYRTIVYKKDINLQQ